MEFPRSFLRRHYGAACGSQLWNVLSPSEKKRQKWKTAHPEGAAYPTPPSVGPIFVGRGRVISGRLANRFGSRFGTKTNLYLFY